MSRSNVAYAALTAADNITRLYTINLTGGAATQVGTIGAGAVATLEIRKGSRRVRKVSDTVEAGRSSLTLRRLPKRGRYKLR